MARKVSVIVGLAVVAALVLWAALRLGSSSVETALPPSGAAQPAGNPATSAVATPGDTLPSTAPVASPYLGIDESLARLPQAPAAPHVPMPPLASLVGQWSGKVSAISFDDDAGASTLIDPARFAPLTLSIVKQGDEFLLKGVGDGAVVRRSTRAWICQGEEPGN